jgi:hypothetical protein
MSLSSYDQVTNVPCVSLLSHDRYKYDNIFVPNTPEHVLVNTRNNCCDALFRSVTLAGSGGTKFFDISPKERKNTRR